MTKPDRKTGHGKRTRVQRTIAIVTMTLAGAFMASAATAEAQSEAAEVWAGRWPNGLGIELAITVIEKDTVFGMYCNVRNTSITVTDLHPTRGFTATEDAGTIELAIRDIEFKFIRDKSDPDAMLLERRQKGKTHRLDLRRTAVEDTRCVSRVRPLSP